MFCKNCGKKISDGAKFCPYCGANIKDGTAKPTEIYIVKKSESYEKAKSVINNLKTIGILESCGLLLQLIFVILAASGIRMSESAGVALEVLFSLVIFGLGIAVLVLLILVWTRYKSISQYTKLSHLWVTVGYPVALGLDFILMILFVALAGSKTNLTWIAVLSLLIVLFIIILSFVLSKKMKDTLHK